VLRILLQSPEKLVLRLEPLLAWAMVVLFGGLALFLLLLALRNPSPFLWYAALASLAIGFGVLALMRFVTLSLSRPDQTLRISRRGIFGGSERVLKFSEIAEVVLEEARTKFEPDDRPNPIYRVVFVLHGGERLPLTPYLDAEKKSKSKAVALTREFIG
jgi:hypothetical protein